jgi:hypothetical protein
MAVTGPMATLGALDGSGALSLATLDDEPAQSPSSDGMLPASMGPTTPRPARPSRSRNEPVDPFAPPELAAEEPLLQLADPVPSAPPPGVPQGPVPAPSASQPGMPQGLPLAPPAPRAPPALPALPPARTSPMSDARDAAAPDAVRRMGRELVARIPVLASPRVRLAVGVALAIALGFVPAHLAARMRERSAFGAIDARVVAVQSTADTPDSYAALDAFRAEQLDAKYRARRSIAVTSLLVWAAAGAALAFAWFRWLPRDRLGPNSG